MILQECPCITDLIKGDEEEIKCKAVLYILSLCNNFNKFSINTWKLTLDSIYHTILLSCFLCEPPDFAIYIYETLLWKFFHNLGKLSRPLRQPL